VGRLDHRALKQLSFGGVEQSVRPKDLVKVCRKSPLGRDQAESIGGSNRTQSLLDRVACSLRHRVNDPCRPAAFGDGVIRLPGKRLIDQFDAPSVEQDRRGR
jgi:hypothetical protein